jgi:chromosome partitioning protein
MPASFRQPGPAHKAERRHAGLVRPPSLSLGSCGRGRASATLLHLQARAAMQTWGSSSCNSHAQRMGREHGTMRKTIAVMNTKGGVGKSTLVLAMAETLSAKFGKNVLVIDADAQASVSLMLMSAGALHHLQVDGATIVDLLVAGTLQNMAVDWHRFAVSGVSDVSEARSVFLIPSDIQLTLFEREVARERALPKLRTCIRSLLDTLRQNFDIILIDCPPGLSVVTECWLREADFYLSPVIPDHLSAYALEVLNHFKGRDPELGFADNLGVLINMRDPGEPQTDHERRLRENADNRCFPEPVPRTQSLQHAPEFSAAERPYDVKYPSDSGVALRFVCQEILNRVGDANRAGGRLPGQRADSAHPRASL